MEQLLAVACQQADAAIEKAISRPCPVKSKLSPRGTIANPAPKALHLDGEELAGRISLENSWLDTVTCDNGFLNFTLSQKWMDAAAHAEGEWTEFPPLPPVPVTSPALIHSEDWFFMGKKASPALCARQDEENVGWLVRMTEERLKKVEPRADVDNLWTKERESLLLRLAAYDESMSEGRLRDYLVDLARAIWQIHPHRLPLPLNRCCQRTLHNGRAVIYRKFIHF